MDFNTLQAACLSCQKCGLCQTRTHVVFGMGSPHAEVMFIGEGPGRNEDEQGRHSVHCNAASRIAAAQPQPEARRLRRFYCPA